ncbi:MAG TPA: phosphotransferase [Actinomycetota bacterium]|nr:phosphotransferase [Actinomycetota bacterium]
MTAPRAEVLRFVERSFPGASVERLAGDASYRVFYRVLPPGVRSVVLMDYGSPFDGETDDVRLGRVFRQAGLRVAELLDVAPEVGVLVLEDLGNLSLESVLRDPPRPPSAAPPVELIRAVDLAARVADRGTPALAASDRASGPALDEERFRFEMDFYLEHFVGGLLSKSAATPRLRGELHRLASLAADCPGRVLCHRDFHSRNLMVLGDGDLAMVDIQDARWGPDAYDLASILRDAYIDIDDDWVDSLIDRYLGAAANRTDPAGFRHRFRLVAGQRMLKALGSFGWLTTAKGTGRYLDAIPRTLARLDRLLAGDDETRELHGLLDRSGLLRV